jgi:rubrerythrin
MRPYRCQICRESYLGSELPERCPFCGAARLHMRPAAEWVSADPVVGISETSRAYVMRSLELELSNTAFYAAVSKATVDKVTEATFKRLSKQELEHAELDCRMLAIPLPALPAEQALATDEANYAESVRREQRAITLYVEVHANAAEPRVREVFAAFAEIEANHLELSASHLL